MKGSNVDELKKLINLANVWRTQATNSTPTPIEIQQINANINGRGIIMAWNDEEQDWEVTAV